MMTASEAAKALLMTALAPMESGGTTGTSMVVVGSGAGELNLMDVKLADGKLMAKVKDYTMGDAPDMIGDVWKSAMLTDKDGNTIVVYSDKGADGGKLFLDQYRGTLTDGVRTYTLGTTNTGDIPWLDVKRPDNKTSGGDKAGSATFKGSVMGVMGTFACETTCAGDAPTPYADGSVFRTGDTAPTATWTFVPGDASAMIGDADADYLIFGWWLQNDAKGTPSVLRTIAHEMGALVATTATATGAALRGTATWRGRGWQVRHREHRWLRRWPFYRHG